MIAEADISGDGRVDYSEFAHLWKTFLLTKHQKPAAGRLQQVPSKEHRILSWTLAGALSTDSLGLIVAHSSYNYAWF